MGQYMGSYMTKAINKLTPFTIRNATKAGYYGDGLGLWLQVSKWGSKSWVFRYERQGKRRELGLGPVHTFSLAEARVKAADLRKLLHDGIDPAADREAKAAAAKLDNAKALTFEQAAKAYIAAHRSGWKNAKHAEQWTNTLTAYAYPLLGALPVAGIDTALVMKVIEPLWETKTETASRLRGRIEAVLDWATVRGHRHGDNPARWRGHLDHLLPERSKVAKVKHHAALPYRQIHAFMVALRSQEGTGARALEFAILTAARSGEVRGATWGEIDLSTNIFTVPANRMKAGKEHVIPLSGAAIALLKAIPRVAGSELVFPNTKGTALSDATLTAVLRRMKRQDITVHGFRSTFRDWAGETTAHPREVIEHALAHQLKDKAEAAYQRGSLFDKRVRLMADWPDYIDRAPSATADVVQIRGAA